MAKRLLALGLAALLFVLLGGCASLGAQNLNDLLRAPALGPGQDEIQKALVAYLGGVEPQYKFPKGGDWLSPLLHDDLDGDGVQEAVLLYSVADNVNAAREKGNNVNVAVLEQTGDGWTVTGDLAGLNAEVASLEVADLLGDGTKQLIVGYATSNFNSKTMGLYTYRGDTLEQLYAYEYSRYEIGDFTGRGGNDLVVVSSNETAGGLKLFYVRTQNGAFDPQSPEPVPLDANFTSCAGIKLSRNAAGDYLLVVDGLDGNGMLSSQLVYYSGEHFYSVDSGTALAGRQNHLLLSRDIDGDGVVEIPQRLERNPITTLKGDKNMEYVEWLDFTETGAEPLVKQFGLLDSDRGVYIRFPESWRDKVQVVDGAGAGEWVVQNRQAMQNLLAMRLIETGESEPVGAQQLPGTTNAYLVYQSGLSAADRDIIEMTSLS